MIKQTQTAINIFTDIYGHPKWKVNEKDGQSCEKIIEVWDKELKDYTEEQVKNACYHIIKFRRTMTFPTLSHILAELCDEEKTKDKKSESERALSALINHQPELSEITIQRTMWRIYGMKYNNYKPDEDKGFK